MNKWIPLLAAGLFLSAVFNLRGDGQEWEKESLKGLKGCVCTD
jgi:hypothetical protein